MCVSKRCHVRVCDIFFVKQKTAYELLRSDWSSDVCSSDLSAGCGQNCGPCRDSSSSCPPCWRPAERSEERRVGKECVSTCRSRRSADPSKKTVEEIASTVLDKTGLLNSLQDIEA